MLNLIYNMAVTSFVFVGLHTFLLHFLQPLHGSKGHLTEGYNIMFSPSFLWSLIRQVEIQAPFAEENRKYINQFFQVHISCYTPHHKFSHGIIFSHGIHEFLNPIRIWPIPIEHFLFIPMGLCFSMGILISNGILRTPMGNFHIPMGFWNFPWEINYLMEI